MKITNNINPHNICNKKCRCIKEEGYITYEYYIQVEYVQHTPDGLKAYTKSLWVRTINHGNGECTYDILLEPFAYDLNEFQIYNPHSDNPEFEIISDGEWDKVVNNEIINHYKQLGAEDAINAYFAEDEDDYDINKSVTNQTQLTFIN